MTIYKLTNMQTGMEYIGATTQLLERRLNNHQSAARPNGRTYLISKAIRESGWDSFAVEVLHEPSSLDELMRLEAEEIARHRTMTPLGYNMTLGGVGTQGRLHSASTRDKISAQTKGRIPWNFGKKTGPMSEEAKLKQSLIHMGQKAWNKGLRMPDEFRQKLVEAHAKITHWNVRPIELDGKQYGSIADACQATGMSKMQVGYRLKLGRAKYLPKSA